MNESSDFSAKAAPNIGDNVSLKLEKSISLFSGFYKNHCWVIHPKM